MTHDFALGEVQSLAAKAARGAGRAVGQAEDAGRAVRWLCARGYDGAGALDALLKAGLAQGLCPLALGGYLSDSGVLPDKTEPVIAPLMLAPALSDLAGTGQISLQGQYLSLNICAHTLTGDAPSHTAVALTLHRIPKPTAKTALRTRTDIRPDTLANLQAYAARTYAPATEDSRARGAGAGTSDND